MENLGISNLSDKKDSNLFLYEKLREKYIGSKYYPLSPQINKVRGKEPMTICIATICENGEAVVLASDQMITAEYPLAITFEQSSKMSELSKSCCALTAGDALAYTELIDDAIIEIGKIKLPSIRNIIECIKDSYVKKRIEKIEEYFLKHRNLSIDDVYKGKLKDDMAMRLDAQMSEYKHGIYLLVGGIDKKGAHIYEIVDPGVSVCFDGLGFEAIGIGHVHAIHSLVANSYNMETSLNKALMLTYNAKHMAERAPGVGRNTDMWYITKNNGIKPIPNEVIQKLNKLCTKQEETQKELLENDLKEIEDIKL